MNLVEVASLWIGGELSWLEQLCLKSFVDAGHRTTLFTYGNVEGVPKGVYVEPADGIFRSDKVIRHARTGSPAYHADVFRLHLINDHDVIWVDTDAYCVRPFIRPSSGHYHGWISDNVKQINNGVLGLPKTSKTLKAMLDFTSDEYPIPPWYSREKQAELQSLKDSDRGVHVSLLPWGVWGPNALTHFLHDTGEVKYAQPKDVIYPVPFSHKRALLKPRRRHLVEEWVTENTTSIHFWGRRFRSAVSETGGIPPKGSYTANLLTKHGIDPKPTAHLMKPVVSNKTLAIHQAELSAQEARQLLARMDVDSVSKIADISGKATNLLIAAHQKFACAIDVVAIDDKGNIGEDNKEVLASSERVKADLLAAGVKEKHIRIILSESDLAQYDIIHALERWCVSAKIINIKPILKNSLRETGHLLIDIQKGSGGYPFLSDFGNCESISRRKSQNRQIDRVIMSVEPQQTDAPNVHWGTLAATLIGKDGFFHENSRHSFTYIKRNKILCVTFDNLDIAMNKREDRRPWGYKFIEDQNWSMLGVMANGWTWYRDQWVFNQFDHLRDSGFFKQFEKVIFYGASMGGYGALVFASACPGAEVVAFSPQTVLDKSVVPWETRYRVAWKYDYNGPYGDAINTTSTAKNVSVFYDPYSKLDANHIARLTGGNIRLFRAPFFGHRLGSMFLKMGILNQIVLSAMNGKLTPDELHSMLRKRHQLRRYRVEIINRLIDRNRLNWAAGLSSGFLKDGPDQFFQKTLDRVETEPRE